MWIVEWIRIKRLSWQADRVHRYYAPEIAALKKEGKGMDAAQLAHEEQFEAATYLHEIEEIYTKRLVRKARKYLLPVPRKSDDSKYWYESTVLGIWLLTDEGYDDLRRRIREEQRLNRETIQWYANVLLGILGGIASIGAVGADAWVKLFRMIMGPG